MKDWSESVCVGFDTETTGVSVANDRIISAAIVREKPSGESEVYNFLINPGVDIPQASTAIHGFTDAQIKAEGEDSLSALTRIREILVANREFPLVAYNAPFDLTVLNNEFKRHGLEPYVPEFVIDPLVIDKTIDRYVKGKGQRKLEPTAARYGVTLVNAHEAEADVRAALAIARAMAKKPGVPKDLAELHAKQVMWAEASSDSFEKYRRKQQDPSETPFVADRGWPLVTSTGM